MRLKTAGEICEICGEEIRPYISSGRPGDEAELAETRDGVAHYVHTDCYRKQLKNK